MIRLPSACLILVGATFLTVFSQDARTQEPILGKDLAEWVSQLDEQDAVKRRNAAFALGRSGKAAAVHVSKLVQVLKNEKDGAVRDAAAYALGEIGVGDCREAIEALKVALNKDPDAKVRRSAAHSLASCEQPHLVVAELHKALRDADAGVRQNAARGLGRIRSANTSEAINELIRCLKDADPTVRCTAAVALGEIGRPKASRAATYLLQCYEKEQDRTVRKAILGALVETVNKGDGLTAVRLQTILRDTQQKARPDIDLEELRNIAYALASTGCPESVPALSVLTEALRDPNVSQRRMASAALSNMDRHAAATVPNFATALKDADEDVRKNAVLALGHIGPKALSAVPGLVELLDAKQSDDIRRYAVEAIALIGPEAVMKALPLLRRLLPVNGGDNSWKVRQRVVWAMSNLTVKELTNVVPDLERVLQETDKTEARLVRFEAAVLLGVRLGPKVPEKTLDVLLENLRDIGLKVYSAQRIHRPPGVPEEWWCDDARWLPCMALAKIGPRANRPDILQELRKLLKSSRDPEVLQHATKALEEITGERQKQP